MRYIRQSYGPCSLIRFHKKNTCEESQIGELPDLNLVPRRIRTSWQQSIKALNKGPSRFTINTVFMMGI